MSDCNVTTKEISQHGDIRRQPVLQVNAGEDHSEADDGTV